MKETTQNKVTVALVCHKEKEKLKFVLEDLKSQSAFDKIKEVLIFQNGTCEHTRKTAETFLHSLPLKIFSSPTNNLGLARANLVKQACCDLIAFTDSDCRLPTSWLEELLSHWKSESANTVVALGGPHLLPEKKIWQKVLNLSLSHPLGHGFSSQAWRVKTKTEVSHIPTTNGLFLKEAIVAVGNFSPLYAFAGEDLDLGIRLQNKGKLILYPQPIVINHYAETYLQSLKRLFVFGSLKIRQINLQFYLSFLFFPLGIIGLIFSFFQPIIFIGFLCYFLLLFLSSWVVGLKNKQGFKLFWLLPLFWFLQHLFYSAGTFLGTIGWMLKKGGALFYRFKKQFFGT